ncbi:dienelactone hydrolase [Aureimonas sp. Leaf460]|nr:dienelactone hydrolase [Aureimonas sp. Leaf427]KQT78056.1 dienelactone hydrolase [Aureimonas sp. Leaf460]
MFRTRAIHYSDGETRFEGHVVIQQPASGKTPCIVLLHDWSGLTEPTMRLAERYAGLGWICIALDLYGEGVRGDPLGDNSALMNPLMEDRALLRRRLMAGFDAACRFEGVDETRIAAIGYCFGGLCALDLARAGPANLKAAISFHGGLQPPAFADQPAIGASILLLHGWEDPIVPPADVLAITRELTDARADWQLHVYGHARHAFTFEGANAPERGVVYDPIADERSWAAMRSHLDAALHH